MTRKVGTADAGFIEILRGVSRCGSAAPDMAADTTIVVYYDVAHCVTPFRTAIIMVIESPVDSPLRGGVPFRLTGYHAYTRNSHLFMGKEFLQPGETTDGVGMYEVVIGDRAFTCLRVLDVGHTITEQSILMEGYLTQDGRTVLCRRYNGRLWRRKSGVAHAEGLPWDELLPTHQRIVIDDITFVHWYDCLSDRACGVDTYSL